MQDEKTEVWLIRISEVVAGAFISFLALLHGETPRVGVLPRLGVIIPVTAVDLFNLFMLYL